MNERSSYCLAALKRLLGCGEDKQLAVACALIIEEELEKLGYCLDSLLIVRKFSSSSVCLRTTKTIRSLVPSVLKHSEALRTTPDGNCFFNALALHFNGCEVLSAEFRLRTCLEFLLRPENLCVPPELQFPINCSHYPYSVASSIISLMVTTCYHDKQAKSTEDTRLSKVSRATMLETGRHASSNECMLITSMDIQENTAFQEGVAAARESSWACWRWTVAAAVALNINILFVRPTNYHSVFIRVSGLHELVTLYWNENHFSTVVLDGTAKSRIWDVVTTAERNQRRNWNFTPHPFSARIELVCLCDYFHGKKDRDATTVIPPLDAVSSPMPLMEDDPIFRTALEMEVYHSDFQFMEVNEECISAMNTVRDVPSQAIRRNQTPDPAVTESDFGYTIGEEERRVLVVLKELFKNDLQGEQFATSGFWSDATIEILKKFASSVDCKTGLTIRERSLVRSRQTLFYFGRSSSEAKRFRVNDNGQLLFRADKKNTDKEKVVLTFEEGYGRMFRLHLSPSLTCLPKAARTLAKEVSNEYHFANAFVMAVNLKRICKGCQISCQLKSALPFVPKIMQSSSIMERLQIDLIDMAPDSELSFRSNFGEYRYVLSITEFLTRFCFLFPLRRKTGLDVAKVLQYFFINEGCPKILHSDNGREFVNKLVKEVLEFGTKMVHGAPYKPTSQGQVERLNQKVKRVLAHLMANLDKDVQGLLWPFFLPATQRILNTTTHESIGITPFEAFKGYPPMPNDVELGIELDSLELEPFHENLLRSLEPENEYEEEAHHFQQMEEAEEQRELTLNKNMEALHGLVEPMRSLALIGLESVAYQRSCTQAVVMEQIERRLYRNVYKPALESRKVKIEKGDIFIWRPANRKRPKSSIQIRAKVVRVLEKRQTLPSTYKIEFYGNGDREPEEKTEDNKGLFTEVTVQGRDLCFCRKGRDNIAKLMENSIFLPTNLLEKTTVTKEEVVSAIAQFADHLRAHLKEERFLSKLVIKELPTENEMKRYFELLDHGAAEHIKQVKGIVSASQENFIATLQELRNEKQFGCWLTGLRKWEQLSKASPHKVQNLILGYEAHHAGSCLDCMGETPKCDHACCEKYLYKLCEKRGGQYFSNHDLNPGLGQDFSFTDSDVLE